MPRRVSFIAKGHRVVFDVKGKKIVRNKKGRVLRSYGQKARRGEFAKHNPKTAKRRTGESKHYGRARYYGESSGRRSEY